MPIGSAGIAQLRPLTPPEADPGDGLVAWNYDLVTTSNFTALTTLVPSLMKVFVPGRTVMTSVSVITNVAANTLVAGSNRVGVYDSTGALLSQSADIAAWPATSLVTTALAAAQTIAGGPGVFVWVAVMASTTVTQPTLIRGTSTTLINLGLPAAQLRFAVLPAVVSGNALPASFVPSTLTVQSQAFWVGVG